MTILQSAGRKARAVLDQESWIYRALRRAGISTLGWVSSRNGIPWNINGLTFRVDLRHYHLLQPEHEAPVAAFLQERVKPGAVCIDVGANVGVYVLQFARWSAPTGQVIAFEPNPTARAALEKHTRINGFANRVRIVGSAISNTHGEMTLYAPAASVLGRLGAPNPIYQDPTEAIQVPVMTLDEFCQLEPVVPDWLLIDIEGFEIAALEGAKKLIESRAGQLGIVVEMHPNVWELSGTSRQKAEKLLSELQLRAVPLTGQRDPLGDHGVVFLEFDT